MAYSGNRAPRQVTLPALSFDDKNISCIIRVRKSAPNQTNCRRKHMNLSRRFVSITNLTCLFLIFVIGQAQQQTPRGITPEDYFSFEFISDPNVSPDGRLVAYVVTKIDRAQNRRNSSIWMAATDGSRAPWQFTTAPQSSTSPRWSPDGKSLAFLSSRPGGDSTAPAPASSPNPMAGPTPAAAAGAASSDQPRNQVYVLSMDGGEAKRITNLKNGVSLFRWSPDGPRLVVVSRIGPSDTSLQVDTRA